MSFFASSLVAALTRREVWLISAAALCLFACDREVERPGQLMVTIDTDMALPDEIDEIYVRVEAAGKLIHAQPYRVGRLAEALMPATLDIASESGSRGPVTVQVAGRRTTDDGLEWRTYRELTTTVAPGRIARLHMPLQWLCKGQAKSANERGSENVQMQRPKSTCDSGFACRAGECEKVDIKQSTLPDFAPEDVFGGGDTAESGSCFDTVACMARGITTEPDSDCRIPMPDIARDRINVALRVSNEGICDADKLNCFVPLDQDAHEGWRVDGDALQLPPAVCTKMQEGRVRAVIVADACETKTNAVPTCGLWSNVMKGEAGEYRPDAEPVPSATIVLTLPGSADKKNTRCCPLMPSGDKLFACVCNASSATVFAIDPAKSSFMSVGAFNPSTPPAEPLAAAVQGNSLYWADAQEVRRTPLLGSEELALGFGIPMPAGFYLKGTLLVDDDTIFALSSGAKSTADEAVQLYAMPRDAMGEKRTIAMGSKPVFQFDQSADAVYLALDLDQSQGDKTRRVSSIVRVDKQTSQRTTVMPERVVMIADLQRGGYVGAKVDGDAVFALFEDAEAASPKAELQSIAVRAQSTAPRTLYELPLTGTKPRFSILGILDGQVLLTRNEVDADGKLLGSTLLMAAADGSALRVIADWNDEYPLDGLGVDGDRIYWLTSKGRLYALPRSVLK